MEKNEKRIRQYALIVGKNVKFPSNLTEADQYIAENAILNEDPREDIKLIAKIFGLFYAPFSFFINSNNKQNAPSSMRLKTMSSDHVCGAVLDEKTAKFKITYDGETYHFCSVTCKKRFKRQPEKFVR
jgi:YHS domain-containing protein